MAQMKNATAARRLALLRRLTDQLEFLHGQFEAVGGLLDQENMDAIKVLLSEARAEVSGRQRHKDGSFGPATFGMRIRFVPRNPNATLVKWTCRECNHQNTAEWSGVGRYPCFICGTPTTLVGAQTQAFSRYVVGVP